MPVDICNNDTYNLILWGLEMYIVVANVTVFTGSWRNQNFLNIEKKLLIHYQNY